ncbi:MAG TPA: T9SS type A sorting domain-containing protein [Bacteroidales bacterium]|nr:T9SS type A sorting domain-containing protein [Bacteroidales bacterium]
MKKYLFILLFLPTLVCANQIWLGAVISEIYFDDSGGWMLELFYPHYSDSILIESDSGYAKIVDCDASELTIISNINLSDTVSFNKDSDCIKVHTYASGDYMVDSICIGEKAGSYLKNIKNGQSIARYYLFGSFYKDNSPTIGFANDFDGAKGKIYGFFYDTDGQAMTNKFFSIDYCSEILREQEQEEGVIRIDETGFYCAEITSRTYTINEIVIASATDYETMQFETVQFDLEEGDSININFRRVLASTKSIHQDSVVVRTYPNPATDIIYFVTSNVNPLNSPLYITVYSSTGQIMGSFALRSDIHQWNCNYLPYGTYIFTLNSGKNTIKTDKFQIIK